MKLNRTLHLSDNQPHVVDERIVLQLNSPGRAQFIIHSPNKIPVINQAVAFDIGYTQQSYSQRLFIGFIEKVVPQPSHKYQLFCRELSAVLNNPLPLNLRHCTIKSVLSTINAKTGLNFSIPEKDYIERQAPTFFNIGNGYHAISQLPVVFKIPDFIWQQQGNGIIYAGSWSHSRWATRKITLPETIFDQHSDQNSAKIPAIPALRPGAELNSKRITKLEFQQNHMTITWKN